MKETQSEQVNHAVFRILELAHGQKDLNALFEVVQGIIGELMQSQKEAGSEAKKDLLKSWSGIDHDLRTPLCGILGFAEILREELTEEESRWKTEQILASAQRIKNLLDETMFRFAAATGEAVPKETSRDLTTTLGVRKESQARKRPKSAGKKLPNVLIVEDNIVNINLLMIYIRRYCNIFSAKDALSAIKMTRREKFDAILMDINLGMGMDGTQAMQEIRKQPGNETIPVIAVTAYAATGDREKFLQAGFNEYIGKPINRDEIKQAMERLFKPAEDK